MLRAISILVLLIELSSAQFCPDFQECTGCENDWLMPDFQETDEYLDIDSCTVTLKWNYPFDEADGRANPRMIFICSYDDGTSCAQVEQDFCASCGEVVVEALDPSRDPHLTYSDSCGHINTIPIGRSCYPVTGTVPTTTEEVTVATQEATTTIPSGLDCGIAAFHVIGGKCMFVDAFFSGNWDEARFFCNQLGADLAILNTDELFLGTIEYINENFNGNENYWIGANDQLIDGTFTWLNSEPMLYGTPYWAPYGLGNDNYLQEPSNQGILGYDCVQMDGSRFLYYDDDDCSRQKAIICEKF